eukprot:COSAG06_NODE_59229_length_275_cov_0.238636_1_plen_41_part_10
MERFDVAERCDQCQACRRLLRSSSRRAGRWPGGEEVLLAGE